MSAPVVSVIVDRGLSYPPSHGSYSPDTRYPEYRHGHLADRNPVYAVLREVLRQAGLDAARYGTSAWNPLAEVVPPGSNVFVLCNFVYHRRGGERAEDFAAKCTHGAVLRAVLDYVLLAAGPHGRVRFGNAPLQSASWSAVLADTGARAVQEFYAARGVAVEPRDLRLYVTERGLGGSIRRAERRDGECAPVLVDLAEHSLLAQLEGNQRFRVMDYDPRRTESCHQNGQHIYALHPDVLDADVIVSIPKLKTHEKVGITCALKGCVGAIALKDCLAHHRQGGPGRGGDEYPSDSTVLHTMMQFHEWLQQQDVSRQLWNPLRVVDRAMRRLVMQMGGTIGGAWQGNDTAWRMALDIARILRFADARGDLQETQQRRHLVVVDGIVGGELAGPLAPHAVDSGVVLYADDPALCDFACAHLMGFDPARLRIVTEALRPMRYPVTDSNPDSVRLLANGKQVAFSELARLGTRFRPPHGWCGAVTAAQGAA